MIRALGIGLWLSFILGPFIIHLIQSRLDD